ncbi:transcriptional regulator [Desulfosarcina widdelii]|uniref:Transcriptional regulator n=1 Tax=Desulfosarcina widdelii TaxID=947919 RepID=A0A5K7Z1M2_9BACT|nr:ImmA/IrrE family metallo-endopeptidase [Desulfosarcina widdelii]BBO74550.1 transcriptional regulator [Desulfosarcina widdelii]
MGAIYSTLNQFSPAKLTLAREFRGLQKKELAEKLEITPSAVTQFESGRVRPNKETLVKISWTLGVPVDFFKHKVSDAKPIPTDICHFRSLRTSSQQERHRVLAAGTLLIELVQFLEEHVEFPSEDISNIAVKKHLQKFNEIELYATTVREKWKLGKGPIKNMVDLLESHGALIFLIPGHSERLDAFSLWNSGRPCIFLSSDKGSSSRSRFDLAHELGHLLMHADVIPGNKELERQADAFASAFLLPLDSFLPECPRRMNWGDWGHFIELKKRWKVSIAALLHRAKKIGCISEATYRRAFMNMNKQNMRKKEPAEPPVENPQLINKAVNLLSENGLSIEKIADALSFNNKDLAELLYGV